MPSRDAGTPSARTTTPSKPPRRRERSSRRATTPRQAAPVYLTLVWCLREKRLFREALDVAEEGLARIPDAILAQWAATVEEELAEAEKEECCSGLTPGPHSDLSFHPDRAMVSAAASERRAPEGLLLGMDALKEETRLRLLRLLERHELGVAPLCEVLQLPQSTVSRHLKVLSDLATCRAGPRGRTASIAWPAWTAIPRRAGSGCWCAARPKAGPRRGRTTCGSVACSRATSPAAQAFFAGAVGQWDRLREEAYGRSLNQTALLALLPADWTVADLGCGTGALARVARAPRAARSSGSTSPRPC